MPDTIYAASRRHLRMQELIAYIRSGEPDLTNRQMAMMLFVACRQGPHPVRRLAAELGVSKPVITRALTSLSMLGLMERERGTDGRDAFAAVTPKGRAFLDRVMSLGALGDVLATSAVHEGFGANCVDGCDCPVCRARSLLATPEGEG